MIIIIRMRWGRGLALSSMLYLKKIGPLHAHMWGENTTAAMSVDEYDEQMMLTHCRGNTILLMVLFMAYGLIIAYKLRTAIASHAKVERALKAERVHCEWLQRRLADNAYYHHDYATPALLADERPFGPREEPPTATMV